MIDRIISEEYFTTTISYSVKVWQVLEKHEKMYEQLLQRAVRDEIRRMPEFDGNPSSFQEYVDGIDYERSKDLIRISMSLYGTEDTLSDDTKEAGRGVTPPRSRVRLEVTEKRPSMDWADRVCIDFNVVQPIIIPIHVIEGPSRDSLRKRVQELWEVMSRVLDSKESTLIEIGCKVQPNIRLGEVYRTERVGANL